MLSCVILLLILHDRSVLREDFEVFTFLDLDDQHANVHAVIVLLCGKLTCFSIVSLWFDDKLIVVIVDARYRGNNRVWAVEGLQHVRGADHHTASHHWSGGGVGSEVL